MTELSRLLADARQVAPPGVTVIRVAEWLTEPDFGGFHVTTVVRGRIREDWPRYRRLAMQRDLEALGWRHVEVVS